MSKNGMLSASPRNHAIFSLRGFIERSGLRKGDRLPAESKLAAQFEVSRMTVRKALDALEHEGLVRRERNLGCIYAANTRSTGNLLSQTIVLVTDHGAASDGETFGGHSPAVVSGVIAKVSEQNFNFLRVVPDMDNSHWLNELISAGTPGVILSCWSRPIDWQLEVLRRLAAGGLPVVAWGESSEFKDYDRVASDHVSGTEKLVHTLADQGCRNILRLWTVSGDKPWIEAHNVGFDKAAKALKLPMIDPVYVENLPFRHLTPEHFQMRVRYLAGYLAEHLNKATPIDAIMISTDCEALAAIAACRLFGREDIRVTGYDNYWKVAPERQWESGIPFATIDKNNHRLGEELAQLLLQRIGGELEGGPHLRLLEQQLVLCDESK